MLADLWLSAEEKVGNDEYDGKMKDSHPIQKDLKMGIGIKHCLCFPKIEIYLTY